MSLKLPVDATDHVRGNAKAVIRLVEYGDFECPHCKYAHSLITRLLKERANDICFVFRNFPLRQVHPHAFISAISAEAAAKQGKYWEMHDLLFDNQNKLNAEYLFYLAGEIGLDLEKFGKDSNSKEVVAKIEADFDGGVLSGVNATPTFFLHDARISYDKTYESLLNPILAELGKQQH
jgi:protein-disulfide isomerase